MKPADKTQRPEPELGVPSEEWRPIPGWEGLYEVSDRGRIYSVVRLDACGREAGGHVLRVRPGGRRGGHPTIMLSRNGKTKSFSVAKLVLLAFRGAEDGRDLAIHADGNPANTHLDNLSWGARAGEHSPNFVHGSFCEGNSEGAREWRRKRREDPEYRETLRAQKRKYNQDPEKKARRNAYERARYQSDPEVKAKMLQYQEEHRERRNKAQRERYNRDPAYRERHQAAVRARRQRAAEEAEES